MSKHQLLIKKRDNAGIKHLTNSNEFIQYWNIMYKVYNNTVDCSSKWKRRILIIIDDTIADIKITKSSNNDEFENN